MQREIKFRAWNPNAKEFQGYAGGDIHMPLHEAGALAASPLIYEFEQYTGLKDKNGVEIYEGDIVRLDEDTTYTVCWNEAGAFFDLAHPDDDELQEDRLLGWWLKEYEVIGNIHQNPELLNPTGANTGEKG